MHRIALKNTDIDGLAQDCSNSSALAIDMYLNYAFPWHIYFKLLKEI